MGHARLASGGQAPDQASSLRSGPMPAAVGGQVRGMTPLGSVIPRVTPTATDTARIITEPWAVSQSFHFPSAAGALLSSDDYGSSIERTATLHPYGESIGG
jgi:hypothetical protein